MYSGFWYNGRFYPPMAGGDGTGDDPPGGNVEGDDDDGDEGKDPPGGGKGGDDKGELRFSQSALKARLKRAEESALEATAKEHGYESAEAMKQALKADKDKRDKEAGELTTTRQQVTDLQSKATAAEQRVRQMALRHAVELEAISLSFHKPEDALALADFSDVEIDDDGIVDRKEVKKLLGKLAEDRPYLVNTTGSSAGRTNGGTGSGSNPPRGGTSSKGLDETRQRELMDRYPGVIKVTPGQRSGS